MTATGTDSTGQPVTTTSSFHTMTPAEDLRHRDLRGRGATYGVGMPIELTFNAPITNKAAVERALQVTASNPVIGAWYWDGSEAGLPAPRLLARHTTVTFDRHLNGIDGGGGRYGTHNLTQTFGIGQSLIAVANTATHQTLIYVGGKLTYTWPISTGKTTTPTPDGTYLTVQKGNPVRMIGGTKGKPGYYNELVNWAVRFTYSGDYYHSAPWSVVNQGTSNVSHGCVNLHAGRRRDLLQPGHPGRPHHHHRQREGRRLGQRLDRVVPVLAAVPQGQCDRHGRRGGPEGSTFVSPTALSADTGTAPLTTSSPGNYFAA